MIDDLHRQLAEALRQLANEADNFNVSGVYFNEKCMGHKGPLMAWSALDAYDTAVAAEQREAERATEKLAGGGQ